MTAVADSAAKGSVNPALNDAAFQKAIKEGGDTGARMTVTGVYLRVAFLLLLLVIGGAFGWSQVTEITIGGTTQLIVPPGIWCLFMLTFVMGFVTIAAYKAAAITSSIYVLAEGTLLGIAARFFATVYDGIVTQAILYTVCIFIVMLVLYWTRIIKVTRGYVVGLGAAIGGVLLAWFVIWLIGIFNPGVTYTFFGPTPTGILFAFFIVVLAALNLPPSFAFIERVGRDGSAPSYMAWFAAFGLVLGLIWLYVSILRLLALLKMAR
jgi:uncharacterized YccA/Bax inhibitor family protein